MASSQSSPCLSRSAIEPTSSATSARLSWWPQSRRNAPAALTATRRADVEADVEAAVADALVTPGEVDVAAAALADGTLAAWVAEAGGSAG